MNFPPFALEKWQNKYSKEAKYNLADTCADPLTLKQLLSLGDTTLDEQLSLLLEQKLDYGEIQGLSLLRRLIAEQYSSLTEDQIIMMNGAASANALAIISLVEPGDRVVAFHPSYQQLYALPHSLQAEVRFVPLRPENHFQPDLEELRSAAAPGTKLILLNNPNNPTGTLLSGVVLDDIVSIARSCGAYILCDEIGMRLRPGTVTERIPSIADLYERGIATSSMSKVLSLAGLRIGWIASADQNIIHTCMKLRDYTTVSSSVLTDRIGAIAMAKQDIILGKNRELLRNNLALLKEWSDAEEAYTFVPPQGGTAALLQLHAAGQSESFCKQLLQETGVLLVPGSTFGLEGYARIGCAGKTDTLKQGLAAMSKFVRHRPRYYK
ncbi:aminotransferase class I/II-fold pyridoxal phosphate-dependent enzyme [Paenibacillus nanensis]|uniref:Aminotransferase n=1 Tax=Paenibacillus nanensis TaxID=393251 RepID=A0A3A1UNU0_9BACL|nr:aminotransferase class I/II-fold pyridoxal phosphate-dependent enzyme [Paenibacillus nanensis]RIX50227.1 aminotransferase class I/II-fold pyridoxal phosphate-dependent enzyme [Paenibacillus nanensis]